MNIPALRRRAISKANRLARELKSQGYPTTGKTSSELWCILSSHYVLDVQTCKKLYIKAGYIPFSGWPLSRDGEFEKTNF